MKLGAVMAPLFMAGYIDYMIYVNWICELFPFCGCMLYLNVSVNVLKKIR